jgi:hypothetical protein
MEKEIEITGNKLIGVFHGAEYSPTTQRLYYESESMRDFALLIHATNVNIEEAKYHTSWDWLMPVVQKIEWLDSKDIDCRITIERQECRIYFDNGIEKYERLIGSHPKIETVWLSIISFINWYNTQSK